MSNDSTKPNSEADLAETTKATVTSANEPSDTVKLWGTIATVVMGVILFIVPSIVAAVLMQSWLAGNGYSIEQISDYFDGTQGQFLFMAVTASFSLVFLALLMRLTSETRRSIALVRPKLGAIGMFLKATAVYYGALLIMGIVVQEFTSINSNQKQETGFDSSIASDQLYMVFISLVILPPLIEEIIFRGFLYTRFRHYYSVIGAAVLISFIFSIGHLQLGSGNPPLWVAAIDTFILSLVLVYLREKTGSIVPGIGLHALKNCMAFAVLFLK